MSVAFTLAQRPEITLITDPSEGGGPVVNLVVSETLNERTVRTLQRIRTATTAVAVLLIGSTITRNGWETLSGPTCSVACSRISVTAPDAASA